MTPFEELLVRTILPHLPGPPSLQTTTAEHAAKRIICAMKEQRIVTIACDDIVGYTNKYSWTKAELAAQGRTESDAARTSVVRFAERFCAKILQDNMVRITRTESDWDIQLILRADLLLPGFAAQQRAKEGADQPS